MARIIVYSEAVHTGKTTRLGQYAKDRNQVYGFLNPDINGVRHLLHLSTQTLMPLDLPEDTALPFIPVGKYRLSEAALNAARGWLAEMPDLPHSLFIVDEVGKLEMENRGLEPELGDCIARFKNRKDGATLILVIRDYLLEAAVKKYDLKDAMIVGHSYFDHG